MQFIDSMARYIFYIFGVLFFLSLALLLLVQGTALFGLAPAWASQGPQGSLHIVSPEIREGESVVVRMEGGGVSVMRVETSMRHNGSLYYRVEGDQDHMVAARDVYGTHQFSVPFLGLWMRTLGTPLGGMALLGAPFIMLVVDFLLGYSTFGKWLRRKSGYKK
jgi:hypothetical protein